MFKVYADDIVVVHPDATPDAALKDVDELHRRADAAEITFKGTKCYFFYRRREVLGHHVSAGCIAAPADRIDALLDLARHVPTTTAELRSLLHAVQAFSAYIPLCCDNTETHRVVITTTSSISFLVQHHRQFVIVVVVVVVTSVNNSLDVVVGITVLFVTMRATLSGVVVVRRRHTNISRRRRRRRRRRRHRRRAVATAVEHIC
jgi:hypothetical protein